MDEAVKSSAQGQFSGKDIANEPHRTRPGADSSDEICGSFSCITDIMHEL
jgi:hypothetical protein